VLRLFHGFERLLRMTGLPTAFLAAGGSQAVRTRLLQPIAGRRLTAVTAVLRQLIFQRLHPGGQRVAGLCLLLDDGYQLVKERKHSGFPLQVSAMDIFAGRQLHYCHRLYYSWLLLPWCYESVRILYA
jgi:hypothetical protein